MNPNPSAAPMATAPLETILEAPFYIPATGPASRPRRSLKSDDTFIVVDSYGDIGASAGGPDGLFHCDTRFLSRLELTINQLQPLLLGSNVRDDNTLLTVDLTNPDMFADGRLVLHKDTLHVVRTIFLWRGAAYQRLAVRNHGDRPVDLRLQIDFGSDFADLFEVRGTRRSRRGVLTPARVGSNQAVLGYQGLDGRTRRTTLSFDPPPTRLSRDLASYNLTLAPGQASRGFMAISCDALEPRPLAFHRALRAAHRERRAATSGMTTIETSNDLFNEVLCRSAADLSMLTTGTPEGRYPYAGIPWYSTTFGRDGLITAMQMLWCNPDVARGVLSRLAAYQAKANDPAADAQPGKILHEMRSGEMAALREVPFGLYYGSVDATPLFVLLAGRYAERTGDMSTLAALWPAIEAALGWIDGPGDPDGDGFVEYQRATEQGLVNQGWKDSFDAIFHVMAASPKATWRSPRCRAMCMRPSTRRRVARAGSDVRNRRAGSKPRPTGSPSASRLLSGARSSGPMRWRSTAKKSLAGPGPLTPDRCCSAASRVPSVLPKWPRGCSDRSSSPAGASGPLPRARRATTRCRITTARSGRTTTR
jgi:glycogen debranching enzyme